MPTQAREQALQRLLEVNLFLYGGEGPSLSYNPESNHVLLMAQARLATATTDSVLAMLRSMAQLARRWRGDHFLQADPSSGASRAAMAVGRASPFGRAN